MARLTRDVAAALTAVAVLAGAPAPVRAAEAPALPVLGARTTITASETSWIDVTLPRSLNAMRQLDLDYRISGSGRVRGFVMVKKGPGGMQAQPLLVALQAGRCLEPGCAGEPFPLTMMYAFNLTNHRLPAGDYRIHLVADGAPVRVRLLSERLRGRPSLRPQAPGAVQIESLDSIAPAGENVFAGGATTDLEGQGLSSVMAWSHSEEVAGVLGGCFYRGDPPPSPIAYVPGCPQATGEPVVYGPYQSPTPGPFFQGIDLNLDRALGAYYTSSSPVPEVGAVALWLKG